MKIVVTGANGFIGSSFVQYAQAQGHHVVTLTRRDADLLCTLPEDHLLTADVLVHCAWEMTHGKFWESDDNARWSEQTIRLYERFSTLGGRYFLGIGSGAEYDWTIPKLQANNPAHLHPCTAYARSKVSCFQELSRRTGAAFAWGRIFFSFGPGETPHRLLPSLLQALICKKRFTVTNPALSRDYIYIDDIGRMLCWAIANTVTGAFNIASGTPIQLGELALKTARYLKREQFVTLNTAGSARPQEFSADLAEQQRLGSWSPHFTLDTALQAYINSVLGQYEVSRQQHV